jgi:hypothetical protein
MKLHFIFDEPVNLISTASISIFESTTSKNLFLFPNNQTLSSTIYSIYNTVVVIQLENFCINHNELLHSCSSSSALFSFLNNSARFLYHLSMNHSTFVDFAYVPNPINSINNKDEGSPG